MSRVHPIGRGGWGEVFSGRISGVEGLDDVALKRVRPSRSRDPDAESRRLHRLALEAAVGLQLEHPSLIRTHGLGVLDAEPESASAMQILRDPRQLFDEATRRAAVAEWSARGAPVVLILERFHNGTLDGALRSTILPNPPVETVLRYGEQVAAALAHMHEAKAPDGAPLDLVHRDVKPANITVVHDEARLFDLGEARTRFHASLEASGRRFGTPHYISPQVAARAPATAADDVWSLGASLFEALTGRPLFTMSLRDDLDGSRQQALLERIQRFDDLTDAAARLDAADVPPMVRDTVLRALAPGAEARPSARELSAALGAARLRLTG